MKIRNIPFGYQMENGRITLYPAESGTVREIFTAYLDGQSLLQIANSLNERNIEYMPGVTGWNKARLKRIIEDARYLGSKSYPAIIGQADFSKAQKIKAERNTQKDTDRTAAVFRLPVPVLCECCGNSMFRLHDSRTPHKEKWICRNCGMAIKISDNQLLAAITECTNAVIAAPTLLHHESSQTERPAVSLRMRNDIGRMLDSTVIDKDGLKNRIFECASLVYSELDTAERTTEHLRAVFESTRPLSCYNPRLTEQAVSAVILHTDKTVSLILKNGQEIRKEKTDAATDTSTAEAGTHHSANRSAGEYRRHTSRL